MKCFDPVLCYTSNGKRFFRNFTLASGVILRSHQQVFDCGKCIFCRKKKSTELAARCVLHASLYLRNCFLTLTYDESLAGYHNKFDYTDIQKFKKRLRKYLEYQYSDRFTRKKHTVRPKIEIFNVHEYGKKGKKHWHLVVFNFDPYDKVIHTRKNGIPLYSSESLKRLWPYGFSSVGDVSEASAMYQAQYTQKDFKNNNVSNSKKSHSKHSGIGGPYFLKHFRQILTLGYIPFSNRKMPVPRFFLRLAHKHWCYFNDQSYFHDLPYRKKQFNPPENPDIEISQLYTKFMEQRAEKIKILHDEWDNVILQLINGNKKPEFRQSGENALYDLKNKNLQEIF